MKISQIGYVPSQSKIGMKGKQSYADSPIQSNTPQLSNVYYSPVNFTHKWQEHRSWGAQFDKEGNLQCKLLSFPDNRDVTLEIIKQDDPDTIHSFPMEYKGEGIWQSPVIDASVVEDGDSYRYSITKADGTVDVVKDPYSYRQKKFMGESVLYNHNNFEWQNDKKWRRNKTYNYKAKTSRKG